MPKDNKFERVERLYASLSKLDPPIQENGELI